MFVFSLRIPLFLLLVALANLFSDFTHRSTGCSLYSRSALMARHPIRKRWRFLRSGNRNKRWASGSLRRVSLWAPQPEPKKLQTWEDVEAWFEVLKAEVKHRNEDRATCRSQAQAEIMSQKRIQLLEACQRFDEFPSDHMLQALLWLLPPTDAEKRHWPQG